MPKRPAIPTIDEVAQVTCDMLRKCYNLQPMLHLCRVERDDIVLLADLPDSADGRQAACALVGANAAAAGPLLAAFLIMEAWAVDISLASYQAGGHPAPRHHPDRRDILLVYGWHPDGRPVERRQFAVTKTDAGVTAVVEEPIHRADREQHNTLLDGFVAGYTQARAAGPQREN